MREAQPAAYAALESRYGAALAERQAAARALARRRDGGDAAARRGRVAFRDARLGASTRCAPRRSRSPSETTGQPSRDVNYIIPRFVLEQLPLGLAGLFIAGVMAAAMSAIAAELNSLATATVIDFYRRWVRPEASDAHFLNVSKGATAFWGVFACVVATLRRARSARSSRS